MFYEKKFMRSVHSSTCDFLLGHPEPSRGEGINMQQAYQELESMTTH